jgi:predicted O-methyltransferase YrrM
MTLLKIDDNLDALSQFLAISRQDLDIYYQDLKAADSFLGEINAKINGVESFHQKFFKHVNELHLYRSLLYLITRVAKPSIFLETGVLNGFSSAFILLALEHNGSGRLISIDLPSVDPEILDQGTGELPSGKKTGWVIPDSLRHRHSLHLGKSQELLPKLLTEEGSIDVFLHDSDHCYTHMMFELCLAYHFVSDGGWILSDNIEQNAAFSDFVRAAGARHYVASSYLQQTRIWQHGLMKVDKSLGH